MSTRKNPNLTFQQLTGISNTELENDTDRALAMAMLRMEQLELQNRVIMAQLAQAQGLPAEKTPELVQDMRGIEEERQRLLANRPQLTEAERARLEQQGIADAQQRLLHKHARFQDHLKVCEKVSVTNPHRLPVNITVQGVTGRLKPGLNNNVPMPFAQAFQDMLDSNAEAERRDALISLRDEGDKLPEYSKLQQWVQDGQDGVKSGEVIQRSVMEFD